MLTREQECDPELRTRIVPTENFIRFGAGSLVLHVCPKAVAEWPWPGSPATQIELPPAALVARAGTRHAIGLIRLAVAVVVDAIAAELDGTAGVAGRASPERTVVTVVEALEWRPERGVARI